MADHDDNTGGITNAQLLEHFNGMYGDIKVLIEGVKQHADYRFDAMDRRFTGVEQRLDSLEAKVENNTRILENVSNRIDDLDISYLPKRMNRVEKHLNLPPLSELVQ